MTRIHRPSQAPIQNPTTQSPRSPRRPAKCQPEDREPPPEPQLRVALATAGVADEGSGFSPYIPPSPPPTTYVRPRDPAYIEVRNWEPGTWFEVLNVSQNPRASFDDKKDVITLKPTGRDINGRAASVWLTDKQMTKLKLAAGHSIRLRATDGHAASESVLGRLEGNYYPSAQRGTITEAGKAVQGSRVRLLDGEASYEDYLLKHINDTSAPRIDLFKQSARLTTVEGGGVELVSKNALEPDATVEVRNARTGETFSGTAGEDQQLRVSLGAVSNGDTLFVTVSDANGNAADPFELRYSSKCKNGRGSTLGILGARLSPVIKRPKAKAAGAAQ